MPFITLFRLSFLLVYTVLTMCTFKIVHAAQLLNARTCTHKYVNIVSGLNNIVCGFVCVNLDFGILHIAIDLNINNYYTTVIP